MGQHHLKSIVLNETQFHSPLPSVRARTMEVLLRNLVLGGIEKRLLNFPEDFVALNSEGFRCSFCVVAATLYRRQIANYKKGLPSSPRGELGLPI